MASSSVNVPTNPKIKEQDVNAKLQLYGIYSGMCRKVACSRAQSRFSQSQNTKLTRDSSLCQWQGPLGQYHSKEADH